MFGVQALYNDGFMLSAVPKRPPWNFGFGRVDLDPATSYKFELYDVRKDWTQSTDTAADNPTKVKEIVRPVCQISGAAARRIGYHACRHATPEPSRRSPDLQLLRRT